MTLVDVQLLSNRYEDVVDLPDTSDAAPFSTFPTGLQFLSTTHRIHRVPGDGNCALHVVAKALGGEHTVQSLPDILANSIVMNDRTLKEICGRIPRTRDRTLLHDAKTPTQLHRLYDIPVTT